MLTQFLATSTSTENLILSDEWLLTQSYVAPLIGIIAALLVNYIFGAIAVSRMMKRYNFSNPALAYVPALRYYYLGKLAYGSATNKGKSALGIIVTVFVAIKAVYQLISSVYLCSAAFSVNAEYPISSFYNEADLFWLESFEELFYPSFLATLDTLMLILDLALLGCSVALFYAFFRRFKMGKAGWFTSLSVLLGLDGIFIFAVRNNASLEEVLASGGFRTAPPFGNPYGAPYGQPNNPYGNPYGQPNNPYGQQGNPYGQNPYGNAYGQQGNPYGQQNGAPFGAPNDPYAPNSANAQSSPFSDLEGATPTRSQPSEPFSEFDNKNNH